MVVLFFLKVDKSANINDDKKGLIERKASGQRLSKELMDQRPFRGRIEQSRGRC